MRKNQHWVRPRPKKAVSPLVASVLLIAFTMAIAAVLTAWISSFTATQREQAAVFEEKISCAYANIEIDSAFVFLDPAQNIMKVRIKNTGASDIPVNTYETTFEGGSILLWNISAAQQPLIKRGADIIPVFNISDTSIQRIKVMTKCEAVWASVEKPLGGWKTVTLTEPPLEATARSA